MTFTSLKIGNKLLVSKVLASKISKAVKKFHLRNVFFELNILTVI